jgi:hypothetical protein
VPEAPASNAGATPKARSLQPPSAAIPILEKAISQIESEDGWVRLDFVGSQLSNLVSDFDVRTFGFRKLSDLVRNSGVFDFEKIEGGHLRIRIKPAGGNAKTKAK